MHWNRRRIEPSRRSRQHTRSGSRFMASPQVCIRTSPFRAEVGSWLAGSRDQLLQIGIQCLLLLAVRRPVARLQRGLRFLVMIVR